MKRTIALLIILAILVLFSSAAYAEGLFNLPYNKGEVRTEITDRAWPAAYGEAAVCIWKDDALATVSLTIDDNWASDHPWWREMGEKYGFKVTWFMVTGGISDKPSFNGTWDEWRKNFEVGHDLQSHTVTHRCPNAKLSPEDDYAGAIAHIQENIIGTRVLTMAYPGSGLPNDSATAQKHFIAARGVGGGFNSVRNTEYNSILQGNGNLEEYSPDGRRAHGYPPDTINPDSGSFRAWNTLIYHGANSPDARRSSEKFYQYLRQSAPDYWIATFTDAAQYGQQRDTATLNVTKKTPVEIAFDLTSKMDTRIYDYPLSVKVRLDPSWNKLTASQAGKSVESKLLKYEGNVYALVQAVPGRGETVLTKQGAEKKFSNSAKLSALEYCIDLPLAEPVSVTNYMPPRLSVPNFNPDALEYKVILPPGTPRATIYATAADPAATFKRDPHVGTVRPTFTEPQTATVTVRAEDETLCTYIVHFAVEPFAPVESLVLTATDCRGAEPNLKQVSTSNPIAFTVKAEREILDESGNVLVRHYDPDTIEWYDNGVQIEGAKGIKLEYLPTRYGPHEIQARAGKVESNKIALTFTKGPPKPTVTILDENFSRHEVGKPVPTSDNPADNKFSATATNINPAKTNIGETGLRVVELDGRKIAAWTATDAEKPIAGLQKTLTNNTIEPLVVAFKVRIDNPAPHGSPAAYYLLGGHWTPDRTHPIWNLANNGAWGTHIPGLGQRPGWDGTSQKWMSVAHVFDPSRRDSDDSSRLYEGIFVGNERFLGTDNEFMAHPARNARHGGSFQSGADGADIAVVLAFGGGAKDPADTAKYTTYLADVKIYRPGSLIMSPAKATYASTEPIRMNFSHHVNINTLNAERVKVTDSKGTVVAIETLTVAPLNFDHFTMNFANGALKKGETYTVALDETVRDILDKTVYDVATFQVQ